MDFSGYSFFFFSSRRRHTRSLCDWSSDVCSSDLVSARSDSRTLATYKGGTFRVKDLARWLLALDPNDVRGISAASDAQLNQFIKVLAQREMLLVEVDKAGVRLSPDDWRRLRSQH